MLSHMFHIQYSRCSTDEAQTINTVPSSGNVFSSKTVGYCFVVSYHMDYLMWHQEVVSGDVGIHRDHSWSDGDRFSFEISVSGAPIKWR